MGSEAEAGKMFGDIPVLAPCVVVFTPPRLALRFYVFYFLFPSPSSRQANEKRGGGQLGIKAKKDPPFQQVSF